MVKYSKNELIKIVKEYSKDLGKTPKMKEVAINKNLPPINQFLKTFGKWNNLLKDAKLEINAVGEYDKDFLLQKLVDIKRKLKRNPRLEDLNNLKNVPSHEVYFRRFGSWNNALKLAGLDINMRKDYTKGELIILLRKKASELGRSPIIKDLESDKNMPDRDTYERYFGSFNKALEASGLEVKYVFRKWTKEELLQKLREKSKKLGRSPTQRSIDKDPLMPGKGNYRKYFGSFNKTIRKAGLVVNYQINEEELIKLLQKLYLKLNRTPTREELNKQKDYPSLNPFVRKFGSYTAACLRAGLVPNDGRNNNIWKGWEKHCIEMATVIHENIEIKNKEIVEGVPDIYVKENKLFIDAKTCGYRDFKEQIQRYCENGHKLEFWCIFKGLETKSKKVRYVYAEELAEKMKRLGREHLAAKCHQFLRNVFDEEQEVLSKNI